MLMEALMMFSNPHNHLEVLQKESILPNANTMGTYGGHVRVVSFKCLEEAEVQCDSIKATIFSCGGATFMLALTSITSSGS